MQPSPTNQHNLQLNCNLDCIKVCPLDSDIWGFSYYQQHPEFTGGIEVCHSNNLQNMSENILALGPIMHMEWLNSPIGGNYQILAAHRNEKVIICEVCPETLEVKVKTEVKVGEEVFCLYCDWVLCADMVLAAVSTNNSAVFQIQFSIDMQEQEIHSYNKHQYAVWATKFAHNKLVVGDEVNTLYLYDSTTKVLLGKNTSAHKEGICDIVVMEDGSIMSGSFDGSIAVISLENFSQTKKKYEIGGTIWRVLPMGDDIFICNSSEHKFQLYSPTSNAVIWDTEKQHTSLAYAAHFNHHTLITVSFYDQLMVIWKLI